MDPINRVLIDRIQRSFPLVSKPYDALSEGLGIDGDGVRDRIRLLKEKGVVRQIGAIFNAGALGYRSSLVAMAVPESEIERAAEVINRHPGVSHNYLRPGGAYNVWYTLAAPPCKILEAVVKELSEAAGGWSSLILPALKKFKLAVVLNVLEETDCGPTEEDPCLPLLECSVLFRPTKSDIRIVRCIQEDLPVAEMPFGIWAAELGMTEAELLDLMRQWTKDGIIRRFAAVLNHRQVGFNANGMVVWNCREDKIDECGRILSSYPEVSHCYQRPAYPDWPYNLYAMAHGRSEEECERIARKLGESIGQLDYRIMFSTREFKKTRLKLFR
ncbi:MAG: Lrp/AsnC family transcriptional regulator [Syntrophobacteraceae bacterium]